MANRDLVTYHGDMVGGWKTQLAMATVAALLICGVMAYRQPGCVYETVDRRPVPEVETIEYFSESLDQVYQLFVQLPPGYADSGKRYPVLYALDGQVATQLYDNAVLPLMRRREIPELIIVGIGYARDQRLLFGANSLDTRRARDFAPVPNPAIPRSGQADSFLTFLNNKVIPFIDSTYRTDSETRAIGGYELAGLFSLYAVLSRPELFHCCLAFNPRLSWGDDQIFDVEAKIAAAGGSLNARVYFASIGEQTFTVPLAAMMADTLRGRGYPDLAIEDTTASGRGQLNAIESAVSSGLRFIYERPL